jgi:hypothetical protein
VTGWFGALQRIPIQSKWPAALAKTGLDQFAFAPIAISGMPTFFPLLQDAVPCSILLPRGRYTSNICNMNMGIGSQAVVELMCRILLRNWVLGR